MTAPKEALHAILVPKWISRILACGAILYCSVGVILFFFQEYILFPVLLAQAVGTSFVRQPPPGVTLVEVPTSDGASLRGWTTYSTEKFPNPSHVAIIFHGNGETVHAGNFLPFFLNRGVPAFSFDYRGYGESTGWPSEDALVADAKQIWNYVTTTTGVSNTRLIVLGNSLGTGIAASLASEVAPKALFLIAGYTSLRDVVSKHPIYWWFAWALRYTLPTAHYLRTTATSRLVLAHGQQDNVIPPSHLAGLVQSAQSGKIPLIVPLVSKNAGHNDIYYAVEKELISNLEAVIEAG